MPSLLSNYTENNTVYMTLIKCPLKGPDPRPDSVAKVVLVRSTVGKAVPLRVLLLTDAFTGMLMVRAFSSGEVLPSAVAFAGLIGIPRSTAVGTTGRISLGCAGGTSADVIAGSARPRVEAPPE
jgi:hypothetical protein